MSCIKSIAITDGQSFTFLKPQKFISVFVYVVAFLIRMSMADFTPFRDLAQKNQSAMLSDKKLTCFQKKTYMNFVEEEQKKRGFKA